MLNTRVIVILIQNVDPFDKPWLKLAVKAATKPPGPKGKVTSARIRGSLLIIIYDDLYMVW